MDVYIPKKLETATVEVRKRHKVLGEDKPSSIDGASLQKLVDSIVSKSDREIEKYAYALKKNEIYALTRYIFTNQFNVPLAKIIRTAAIRVNESLFNYAFMCWQDVYVSNSPTIAFSGYLKQNETIGWFEKKTEFERLDFLQAIVNLKAVPFITDCFAKARVKTKEAYIDLMKKNGIVLETKLGQALLVSFYCICGREAYLEAGETLIYDAFTKAGAEFQDGILRNFILQMPISANESFKKLIPVFFKRTGNYGNATFNQVLAGLDGELIRKYRTWISEYEIGEAFKMDADRSRLTFWKRYSKMCDTKTYSIHGLLVMDFGSFVATEFVQIGAIYWFDKDYYKSTVEKQLFKKTADLKSWLANSSKYLSRKTHQGYWTNDAEYQTGRLLRRK